MRQGVDIIDAHRARSVEIAFVGKIRALAVVDAADQFGDHEVEIGIALPVRVRAQIDRHIVERDVDVGAVVEIESAQEILVRLALGAVLDDDQAGHGFEELAGR